jgi:RHS repeat-associated protein
VSANAPPVTTIEHLPIVTIGKSGPPTVTAGTTATYPLALTNVGGAIATVMTVTDTIPAGANGTVTGVPSTLAPQGTSSGTQATFPVPLAQSAGNLTDTATLTWQDANQNTYGPVTSSFTTQVQAPYKLTLPTTAGPNPTGATQSINATLVNLGNGQPVANQVVTLTVTGANPQVLTATTDATGIANFSYVGANKGTDQLQATASTAQSNTLTVTWFVPIQKVTTTRVQGNFYAETTNPQSFAVTSSSVPDFGQSFPGINFNPPAGTIPHSPTGAPTDQTRPFTDVTTDVNGNYNGTIVAQGNNLQAGLGNLTNFDAVFTANLIVAQAGDVTFNFYADDGFLFGVGNGASRISGAYENPPTSNLSAIRGYPLMGAFNLPGAGTRSVTVHFPAAGTYPYEVDYFEANAAGLSLTMSVATFTAQTNPLSIYVGYADGLRAAGSIFPFPWLGSPGVTFIGCCPSFDAGAIRFDNSSNNAITLDSVTVDIGGNHFDLWGKNLTVPANQILMLSQTGQFNFDTSDYSNAGCGGNNGVIPKVNVTIAGVTTTYNDTNQILNTFGFDLACRGNESQSWQRIGGGGNTINVPLPPATALALTPATVTGNTVGQTQTFTVSAMDVTGQPVASLPVTLTIAGANGSPVLNGTRQINATTDTAGLARFSYVGLNAGIDTAQVSAFVMGLQALSNSVSVPWSLSSTPTGGTAAAPAITGPSPADGTVVTKPVPISASFTPPAGQSITSWSVTYQDQDPSPPVTLATGTGVPPPTLAVFDPTLLPNDTYLLAISATASGGGTQTLTTSVIVYGNLKLGRYITTYQDLSVPVNGFQMEVRRVYDSIDKHTGDFGVGWHVDLANFRVSTNRQLGAGGWSQYNSFCGVGLCLTAFKTSAPHFVMVVFPDGHSEIFDFTPTGGTNIFLGGGAAFTARPGTTSTLEGVGDTGLGYQFDGNLYGGNGQPYSPTRFKLTTHDGRVLILDTTLGLISQTDRHGNSLTVDASGVHASNGQSITYTRDNSGRITGITGPSGQVLTYTYSASGDLASSTDSNNNPTSYSYDTTHDLLKAAGAAGQPIQTLQYDSGGRLSAVIDALGNSTQIANNVSGQQQTITDPAGKLTTVFTYDGLGDVVRQDQISGGQTLTTSATYDSAGRPLTRTDPSGNVWKGSYDANGEITTLALPSTHSTGVTYDSTGRVTAFTDALGHSRTFGYDALGNLASYINALGARESFTYDAAGHVLTHVDAIGRTSRFTYDAAGNSISTTDPQGNTTTQAYDGSARVKTQTDALNHTTTYVYDGNGNVTSVTDALGNITRYGYNAFDQLTSATDPAGKVTTYAYDAANRLASQTDPLARTTTYTYDADSRLTSITDATGAATFYAYDGFGRLTSERDALGRTTTYSYDSAGRPLTTTKPNGGVVKDNYDTDGHLVSETDALGHTTGYGYDAAGHRTSVTDPLGLTTNIAFDAEGRQVLLTDPLGNVAIRGYDAAGQLVSAADALGRTTKYAYDGAGNVLSVTDPLGHVTAMAFDAANRRIKMIDPLGRATSYSYDAAGQLTSVTMPSGATGTIAYDPRGLVTSVTDALNHTIRYGFDDAAQLTSMTDPLGRVTTYGYDAAGRQTKTVDALGGSVTIGFDAGGQRISVVNPNGNTTKRTYDSLGNVATDTNPAGGITTNSYDLAGELTRSADPRGVAVTYGYDADGHQVTQGTPGGTISTSYDNGGRRTKVIDSTGTTTYTFDAGSQLTSLATPQGSLSYTYDNAGNRATMTIPGGKTVTYSYDAANQLTQLKDMLGNATTLTYSANGSLASMTRPNGVVTTLAYDAVEQLVSLNHDGPAGPIAHDAYTYDANGNRTSFTAPAGKEQYTFDALNRLTQATYPNGDAQTFTYDPAGNRTAMTVNGSTTNYSYNSAGQLTSAGSTAYAYDAAGNVTTAGTKSFTWDYADRLTGATVGGTTSSYTYNADGTRSTSTNGTTTNPYLTDASSGLPQVVDDGSTSYVSAGTSLTEQVGHNGVATYPLGDALGSVRQITDAAGANVGNAAYDAFGGLRSQSGASSIFGFTAQQTDPTGLLFLRARYLDPTTGRFLSADSLQPNAPGTQGFNAYSYVAGRPTSATDPTGHSALAEFAGRLLMTAAIAAGAGAVLGALLCPHDANYRSCVLRSALLGLLAGLIFALFPPGYALFGSELAGVCAAGAVSSGAATGVGQLAEQSPDLGSLASSAGLGCVTAGLGKYIPKAVRGAVRGKTPPTRDNLPTVRSVPREPGDIAREQQYPKPPRPNQGKGTIGPNPRQAQDLQGWLQYLRGLMPPAEDVRVNQEEVNAQGVRVGQNRPDLQFTWNGQRYYVELDTPGSPRGGPHAEKICANDPAGIVILVTSPNPQNLPDQTYACS